MKIGLHGITYRGVWYRGEAEYLSALRASAERKIHVAAANA